jgi:cytochrome c
MTIVSRLRMATCALIPIALLGFGNTQPTRATDAPPTADTSYASVAPVFNAHCISCHNADHHPKMVDLSSYDAVMKSGKHGPIVIAGDVADSKLIKSVDGEKTPTMPIGKPPLSDADIALLKQWIAAGAKG